jgi:sugar/nucleoside kinase (ribokinase family)
MPDDRVPLVVFGQLTIDELAIPTGGTRVEYTGDAPYTAIGAALWLRPVGMVAPAGSDFPLDRLAFLREFGIHDSGVVVRPSVAIRYEVLYERDGSRRFVERSPRSAFHATAPVLTDMPEEYRSARGYHVAAMPLRFAGSLLRQIREAYPDALIMLDTHEDEMAGNHEELAALLPLLTAFLPSREEVQTWLGYDDPERSLTELSQLGPKLTIIKMGREGALLRDATRKSSWYVPPCSGVVVDPTGAGDAFCGGFLAGLALGDDPPLAARRGAVSASYAVAALGAPKHPPPPDELEERLRSTRADLIEQRDG